MDVRMDGRRALITGGSQGLGFAMAKRFAESGADVGLLARNEDTLAEAKKDIETATGRTAWTYSCDVGRADRINDMYAALRTRSPKPMRRRSARSVPSIFWSITPARPSTGSSRS